MNCNISTTMWDDERVSPLSLPEKLLWVFILSGNHVGVPGLWVVRPADMAERVGVSSRSVMPMLSKMCGLGILDFNKKLHVARVPSAPRHNRPASVATLESWFRRWHTLPRCEQKAAYAADLREQIASVPVLVGAWDATFGDPIRAASRPSLAVRPHYPAVPRATTILVAARDGGRCRYCGVPADSIDHVLPRQQGGGNEPENLVACCLPCNKWKRSRTPEQAGMTLRPIPTLEVLHA